MGNVRCSCQQWLRVLKVMRLSTSIYSCNIDLQLPHVGIAFCLCSAYAVFDLLLSVGDMRSPGDVDTLSSPSLPCMSFKADILCNMDNPTYDIIYEVRKFILYF